MITRNSLFIFGGGTCANTLLSTIDNNSVQVVRIAFFLVRQKAAPILFLLSLGVSVTSGTMYIYIYIYINSMADATSVHNLLAKFGEIHSLAPD